VEQELREKEGCEHPAWLWTAMGLGAVAGAVAVVWLMQYRKPDRSAERLLRRCADRLDTIEESMADLLGEAPDGG
jgi:hypothetical protein